MKIGFDSDAAKLRAAQYHALADQLETAAPPPRTAAELEAMLGPVWGEYALAQANLEAARHSAHLRVAGKARRQAGAVSYSDARFSDNEAADVARWRALEI